MSSKPIDKIRDCAVILALLIALAAAAYQLIVGSDPAYPIVGPDYGNRP